MVPYRDEVPAQAPSQEVESFLEEVARRNVSEVVLRNYREVLENFEAYLRYRDFPETLQTTNALVVHGYGIGLIARGASEECIAFHIDILKEFFSFLQSRGIIAENPMDGVRLPASRFRKPGTKRTRKKRDY